MQLKTIVSEGLAHYAYLVVDGGEAALIDPGRDIDRYLKAAAAAEARITRIFETHRNEDYISGACELAERTGADVWRGHAPDHEVAYARPIRDGQCFEFGGVRLTAIETPGHTEDSISIVLAHLETGEEPIAVFTGDALFVGDVGRTDFDPERAAEAAGSLHDSLHRKLLPLGDSVLVYPAHGAGSVCGSGMAKRTFTSIGYERANNPRLQLDRKAFIAAKTAEHHYFPPYFERMQAANSGQGPGLGRLPDPQAMSLDALGAALKSGAQLLDLRPDPAVGGACVREAIAIPLDMLASFGGWFLDADRPLVLLLDAPDDRETAVRTLVRIGYDRIEGFLASGFEGWATAGRPVASIPGLDVHALRDRLDGPEPPLLLDVRALDEYQGGHIEGSRHHYVGEIATRPIDIPLDRAVVTFCGSGRRALIAAAALRRLGWQDVSVCWGSMKAWKAAGYPLAEKPQRKAKA